MQRRKKVLPIFIISDSTGATAETVINAALVQFSGIRSVRRRFPYARTKKQISSILDQARAAGGIVIYSLVSRDLRAWISREKRERDVYALDLLGPLLNRIQRQWGLVPRLEPGLFRGVEEESVRVAEAVEFTLNHDDGHGVETLGRADLIVLGVSRTSKTPTSLYLSCNHGLKVANVPIVAGLGIPDKVFTLKNQKIGLMIELERLAFLRRRRWKQDVADYVDVSHIRKELDYSEHIFRQIKGIQVIDVTYASIEEVAARIMETRKEFGAQAA
jgi:regulator of PEP synthase PpsR (kinase-PPPase family)